MIGCNRLTDSIQVFLGIKRCHTASARRSNGLTINVVGHVTSGTLAPTANVPIAMAYLAANHALPSHEVYAEVRGKRVPMRVSPTPFVPHRYHRG